MRTKENYGEAVVSVDILDINSVEMRQMVKMEERIAQVLFTHIAKKDADGNAIKAEYLSDDELRMIRAMLHTFTRNFQFSVSSAFDDTLKTLTEEEKHLIGDTKIPDDMPI